MSSQPQLPDPWNDDRRPRHPAGGREDTPRADRAALRGARHPFIPPPIPTSETAVSQADGQA